MRRSLRHGGLAALAVALCIPSAAVVISTAIDGVPASVVSQNSGAGTAAAPQNDEQAQAAAMYANGTSPNPGMALVGREGWVFYGDPFNANLAQAAGTRYYSDEDLAMWAQSIGEQQKWLASRGIPVVFIVAPAKWSIYPDKLPEGTKVTGTHIFDQLLKSHPELSLIDVRPALKKGRDEADTYSKLNGHWTDYGAYVAWRDLVEQLQTIDPAVTPNSPPAYSSIGVADQGNEYADILKLHAPNPWTYPVLTEPLPDVQIVSSDGTTKTVPGKTQTDSLDMPREIVSPSASNSSRVLALCDSACRSLSPYLQSSYASTMQVRHAIDHPEQRPSVPYLVDTYKPTFALYVMTERNFNNVLADGPMWAAANAYDEAQQASVATWAPSGSANTLTVSADPSESVPASIKWPRKSGAVDIAKLEIDAQAFGQLQLHVAKGAKTETISVQYPAGRSELFYALPKATSGMTANLLLAPGSGAVSVLSAEVRRSPAAG